MGLGNREPVPGIKRPGQICRSEPGTQRYSIVAVLVTVAPCTKVSRPYEHAEHLLVPMPGLAQQVV